MPADTKLTQHFKRCLSSSTLSIGRSSRDANEGGTDIAGLRNGCPATAQSSALPLTLSILIFHVGISTSSGRTLVHAVRGRTRAEPALFVDKVSFLRTLCHLWPVWMLCGFAARLYMVILLHGDLPSAYAICAVPQFKAAATQL